MEKNFGTDLSMAIDGKGYNPTSFSEKVDVSANSVLKWIKNESFPRPDKWGLIFKLSGINPQLYVNYQTGEKGVIRDITQTAADNARQLELPPPRPASPRQ